MNTSVVKNHEAATTIVVPLCPDHFEQMTAAAAAAKMPLADIASALLCNWVDRYEQKRFLVMDRGFPIGNFADLGEAERCATECASGTLYESRALVNNFAYLRTRKIDPTQKRGTDHAQVWLALQLMHCETFNPQVKDTDKMLAAGDDTERLVYVLKWHKKLLPALTALIERSQKIIVYSWEPEWIAKAMPGTRAKIEAIPVAIARRFGEQLAPEGAAT